MFGLVVVDRRESATSECPDDDGDEDERGEDSDNSHVTLWDNMYLWTISTATTSKHVTMQYK